MSESKKVPVFPGYTFTPFNTDSIGVVKSVGKDKDRTVTFSYEHEPNVSYTYGYHQFERFQYPARKRFNRDGFALVAKASVL